MMNGIQNPAYEIFLSDGSCLEITAAEPNAALIVKRLAEVMSLRSAKGCGRQMLVRVQSGQDPKQKRFNSAESMRRFFEEALSDYPWNRSHERSGEIIHCNLRRAENGTTEILQLMQISFLIVLDAVTRGGMLLHGALVERNGQGVILAGPGGVGKTTASNRMPSPWRALCDDQTLIVRDQQNKYWAHPWPTWSRFMFGREGGSWDMQNAVPLGLIFFLAQAKRDRFQPISEGEAVCLLSQASLHSGLALMRNLNGVNQRKIHFQLFESVCRLAKSISCYDLQLTLNGSFWVEIEQALLSNMIYNRKTAEI